MAEKPELPAVNQEQSKDPAQASAAVEFTPGQSSFSPDQSKLLLDLIARLKPETNTNELLRTDLYNAGQRLVEVYGLQPAGLTSSELLWMAHYVVEARKRNDELFQKDPALRINIPEVGITHWLREHYGIQYADSHPVYTEYEVVEQGAAPERQWRKTEGAERAAEIDSWIAELGQRGATARFVATGVLPKVNKDRIRDAIIEDRFRADEGKPRPADGDRSAFEAAEHHNDDTGNI